MSEVASRSIDTLVQSARERTSARDWSSALSLTEDIRRVDGRNLVGWLVGGLAFRRLSRFDEADDLLSRAVSLFPNHFQPAVDFAWSATERGDRDEALRRWSLAKERHSDRPAVWTGFALGLRQLRRFDEAESVLQEAIQRFPTDIQAYLDYARVADERNDSQEALERWDLVRRYFPHHSLAWTQAALVLRRNKEFDRADSLLDEALERFPDDAQISIDRGWLAIEQGRWPEAAERLQAARARFPATPAVHAGLGLALDGLGERKAAEECLLAAAERFPASEEVATTFARLASRRGDWTGAVRRWTSVADRFPANAHARELLAQAKLFARFDDELARAERARGAGVDPSHGQLKSHAPNGDEFWTHFESLGANCEFGLVQRRFGVEPLGLLRWAGTPLNFLIQALDLEFAEIGSPDRTTLDVVRGEWVIRDSRWRLTTHTFISESTEPHRSLLPKMLRRQAYLRTKLLGDLRAAEKIFVYQEPDGMTVGDARRLCAALRRYGPTTLLCVLLADPEHGAGRVDIADTGLLIGYIDRLGPEIAANGTHNWNKISLDVWQGLCSRALALARGPCASC